ncbi:MAG: lactate utilization protein [Thermodesulfobacteriota bacterium]|nr:lactate utilization protein [Thermodesulfobacteriota bacterium]
MKNPIDNYWKLKLELVKEKLKKNSFDPYIAENTEKAKEIVLDQILLRLKVKSISWGGSMTFVSTGLFHALKDDERFEVLNTFDRSLAAAESMALRRKSLLVDLFITGTNGVTEDGQLVNLDMIGNRVCGITFGPKNVIILVGRNKICSDIEDAMFRIKNYAAPVNAMNLDKKTPCREKGFCHDCSSPDRICNTWTITEKSFPKDRVKVILINEDLGF